MCEMAASGLQVGNDTVVTALKSMLFNPAVRDFLTGESPRPFLFVVSG